ncbi:hypothetical protein BKA93DRAFT_734674 [Sparassis latifolia]
MDTSQSIPTTPTLDVPGSDSVAGSRNSKSVRRSVAFYPNMNSSNKLQKPFSRSAAKRESVMALGSIEHLQHYFTKSGIAAESNPLNKPSGAVPAIGGPSNRPFLPRLREFDLPPPPVVPEFVPPAFPPFVKTYETDPANLRPGVIDDLSAVAAGWNLDGQQRTQAPDPNLLSVGGKISGHVDVLELLKITTRAVRTVRNYLVSLPDESATPRQQQHFRPQNLASSPLPKRLVSQPDSASEPLTGIRRGALEVLTVLRDLEEYARLPLEDDAYDARSESENDSTPDATATSRGTSPITPLDDHDFLDGEPTVSISLVDVGGRKRSIPIWEDEASMYDVNNLSEEERDKRDHWDERLVLGGGWLYRQDVRLDQLDRQRMVIGKYVVAVDEVLFGGGSDGKRGWERERERVSKKEKDHRSKRRVSEGITRPEGQTESHRSSRRVVSTGMLDAMRNMVVTEEPEAMESLTEEDSVDDEDLPEWAKRSSFTGDPLGRLHALLLAYLPSALQPLLPSSSADQAALLQALSSGQLLCVAYNVGVRRSRKPWGFVSKDAIHDIAALEAQSNGEAQQSDNGKRGWTFRRTDNLQLWTAALKLRYLVPIISSTSKAKLAKESLTPTVASTPHASPSHSVVHFPGTNPEDVLVFDAAIVARQEKGWEHMLETVVLKWVEAVVDERRGDR